MGMNADFQMDWDNIRIFLSVARAGQFSAAASQLRLDNATVGRRINALEKSLGVRLFDRQTTGSVLTAAGDRLYKAAEEVEAQLLRAVLDLRGQRGGVIRQLALHDNFSGSSGYTLNMLSPRKHEEHEKTEENELQISQIAQIQK